MNAKPKAKELNPAVALFLDQIDSFFGSMRAQKREPAQITASAYNCINFKLLSQCHPGFEMQTAQALSEIYLDSLSASAQGLIIQRKKQGVTYTLVDQAGRPLKTRRMN